MMKKTNGNGTLHKQSNIFGFSRAKREKVENVGDIGAGKTLEFLPSASKVWITRPSLSRANDNLIRVSVRGDSLSDEGINDGDFLVCRTNFDLSEVRNGALVVARICPTNELTVKRVYFENEKIILRASNPFYNDLIFSQNAIEFQAIALELVRIL